MLSYEFFEIFKNTFFVKHLRTAASVYYLANINLEKCLLVLDSLLIHYQPREMFACTRFIAHSFDLMTKSISHFYFAPGIFCSSNTNPIGLGGQFLWRVISAKSRDFIRTAQTYYESSRFYYEWSRFS